MFNCPDCGKKNLEEVVIERFMTRKFRVNYEEKVLIPVTENEAWDSCDYAVRCPECDTLNTDDMFVEFEMTKADDRAEEMTRILGDIYGSEFLSDANYERIRKLFQDEGGK